MTRDFMAQYAGVCAKCDGAIVPGKRVVYVDDELCHLTCPPVESTCPTCFLTLPASGVCGVCE